MNPALPVSTELCLAVLFVLGAIVGMAVNLAIYQLAWQARPHSPWAFGKNDAGWRDRLPIIGWLTWRRKERQFGQGFWLRPLLIELLCGCSFAALFWWEVAEVGLLGVPIAAAQLKPEIFATLCLVCACHLILVALMMAASFIDLDEMTIPDWITIPGTLAGLMLAILVPNFRLPILTIAAPGMEPLHLASPAEFPASLLGRPDRDGLWLAVACYAGWCFALLPRSWRTRRGVSQAFRILFARIAREPLSWFVLLLFVAGNVAITVCWWRGGHAWQGLLSSLVGMAASGGLIWVVRLIGTFALQREAMGFGDVTLMAMIGTFLGWQPCLLVFFLSPLFALLMGIGYWALHRRPEIPYGPFLCLGTVAVIVAWAQLWNALELFFSPIWLVPMVISVCMVLMGVILWVWAVFRSLIGRGADSAES